MEDQFLPCYIKTWQNGQLSKKIEQAKKMFDAKLKPRVSGWEPSFGDERPLVGQHGSGAINFDPAGKEISINDLAQAMLELQQKKCHNIKLVMSAPQTLQVLASLEVAAKAGLQTPLVYSAIGSEPLETIKLMEGLVDIYLFNSADFSETARANIKELFRQVGNLRLDNEVAVRGLLVRHIVTPGSLAISESIFKFLVNEISKDLYINIKALDRKLAFEDFKAALDAAKAAGLHRGFF